MSSMDKDEEDDDAFHADLAEIASRYTAVNWKAAWLSQPADVDWLFGEFIERGTVNALFAKPGTGKSLLALEIAVSIARGGRDVLYIDDENRIVDLVERLQAFGCEPDDLDRLHLYSFASLPPLDSNLGGAHLLALSVTTKAALVILDTTTRMVAGRENDSDTFLQLYRCSLVPLKSRGITVLRLDHPGKDSERGQRGSSAKDGDVDTVWELSTVTDGLEYRLSRSGHKSRSGHGPETFTLNRRYEPLRHEWTDGEGALPEIAVRILNVLNDENVPLKAGRETVRKVLTAHDIKASNEQVSAAIKARKNCPGQFADSRTAVQPKLSAAVPHVVGDSGQFPAPAPACSRHASTGFGRRKDCADCDKATP
jgi:AAA domain